MTSESNTQWQSLRIGDKIQIVRIPTEMSAQHYHNGDFNDLFDLYAHLIATAEVLTIYQIDDDGRPWIEYNWIASDGDSSHSLAVDDDSWVHAS